MYGRRTTSNAGELNLLQHSETPARTAEVVNPFNVTGEAPVVTDYPDKALLQVHGQCLALITIYTAMHDTVYVYRYTDVDFLADIGNNWHLCCVMDETSTSRWRVVPGTPNSSSDHRVILISSVLQTHRALLIISLFTSAGGVIFAFAALAKNPLLVSST